MACKVEPGQHNALTVKLSGPLEFLQTRHELFISFVLISYIQKHIGNFKFPFSCS